VPGLALGCALALSPTARGVDPPQLLQAERAFALSVQPRDGSTVIARFTIADGYYLYRDKLRFAVADGALAAPASLPQGKAKNDPFFGNVEIYRGGVTIELKLDRDRGGETIRLEVESQGCADLGVCYPLRRQAVAVALPRAGAPPGPPVEAAPPKKTWFN
jgi:thiol:disulfide interchange protein DsbD